MTLISKDRIFQLQSPVLTNHLSIFHKYLLLKLAVMSLDYGERQLSTSLYSIYTLRRGGSCTQTQYSKVHIVA